MIAPAALPAAVPVTQAIAPPVPAKHAASSSFAALVEHLGAEPAAAITSKGAKPVSSPSAAVKIKAAVTAAPAFNIPNQGVVTQPNSDVPRGASGNAPPDSVDSEPAPQESQADETGIPQENPIQQEVTAQTTPVDARPIKGKGLAALETAAAATRQPGQAQIPFLPVIAPLPPTPLPAPKLAVAPAGSQNRRTATEVAPQDAASSERLAINDGAVEIRIRVPKEQSTQPQAEASASPAKPAAKEAAETPPVEPQTQTQIQGQIQQAQTQTAQHTATITDASQPVPAAPAAHVLAADSQAAPAEITIRPTENLPRPATDSAGSPPRPTDLEEPAVARETPQQPLRALSLEFSPDGAGDVRLRLSEKAGEVHISLHSPDAALSGRLHAGVHDLVGSLTNAGYEAEAGTPGQGQRNDQGEADQRRNRRPGQNDSESGSFGDLFPLPVQENP